MARWLVIIVAFLGVLVVVNVPVALPAEVSLLRIHKGWLNIWARSRPLTRVVATGTVIILPPHTT